MLYLRDSNLRAPSYSRIWTFPTNVANIHVHACTWQTCSRALDWHWGNCRGWMITWFNLHLYPFFMSMPLYLLNCCYTH